MIDKYKGMTAEQLARTLTGPMRTALYASIETEHVDAPTGTSVALIDRGLIEGGRVHPLTDRGREVAAFIWPEAVERAALAKRYELRTGRSASGLTVEVLRGIAAELRGRSCCSSTDGDVHNRECTTVEARKQWAPTGSAHGPADLRTLDETRASRGQRAVEAVRNPRATERVVAVGPWRAGQSVRVDATFAEPGDVWTIRELVVDLLGEREPYAAIELASRVGGLPIGTTSSAVGLEWLRPVGGGHLPPAPRGTVALTETLMSVARTAASSRGQFVEYEPMRAALRAAFLAVGLRVEATPGIDAPDVRTEPAAPVMTAGHALRKLRDDHLPMWLRTCIENDEAMQRRDRETDPERYPLHAADVRVMIADVARECGLAGWVE